MRLTPLRSPTRPASDTVRRFRPPRKEKRRARAKAKAAFRVAAGWTNPYPTSIRQISSTQGVDLPCRPRSTPTNRHRETVEGGEVWVGRTVGAMDGAIEPPGVRALCLRSTASQAPERPAASGWAGLGVRGVSCQPTPPRPTRRNPEPLWLWTCRPAAGTAAGAGCNPAKTKAAFRRPHFSLLQLDLAQALLEEAVGGDRLRVPARVLRGDARGQHVDQEIRVRVQEGKSGFGCRKNGTE